MAQDTNASPRKGLLIAAAATALTLAAGVTAGSLLGYVGPGPRDATERGRAGDTSTESAPGSRESIADAPRGRAPADAPTTTETSSDVAGAAPQDSQAFQEPPRSGREHHGREHHGRDHAEHERAEHERGDDDDD